MKTLDSEGPFLFPLEMQVYWIRRPGMSLRDSFLEQLEEQVNVMLERTRAELVAVTHRPGDLNAGYNFVEDSSIDSMDIEIPQPHDLEAKVLEALTVEEDDVKPGEFIRPGGKDDN